MNRDWRDQNKQTTPEDLGWLAFLYVSDELEATEREAFEARLESDELAQQALVEAVEQTQLIYASHSIVGDASTDKAKMTSVASTRIPLLKRPSVLLAAAAAMLLAIGAWSYLVPANNSTNPEVASVNGDDDGLAEVWADAFAEKEELVLDAISDEAFDDFEFDNELAYDSAEDSEEDWMFVALTGLEPDDAMEVVE